MSTNQPHHEHHSAQRQRIVEEVTGTEERPLRMGLIFRTLIVVFYSVLVTLTSAIFFPLNYWFSEVSEVDPLQVTEDIWAFIADTQAGNITLISTLAVTALLYWFLVFRINGNTAFLQAFNALLVTTVLHPLIYIVLTIWNITAQGGRFHYAVFADELGTVAFTAFFTGLVWGIILALVFRSHWRYSVKHVTFHRVPNTPGDDATTRSYDPLHGAPDPIEEDEPVPEATRPTAYQPPEQLTADEYLARLRAAGATIPSASTGTTSATTTVKPKRPHLELSFTTKVLAALGFALLFELLGQLGKAAYYRVEGRFSLDYLTGYYANVHFYHPIHHQMALLSVLVAALGYYLLVFIWPRLNTFKLQVLAGGFIGLIVHALSQLNTMLVFSDLIGYWDDLIPQETLWFAVRGAAAGALSAIIVGLVLYKRWHTPPKPEPKTPSDEGDPGAQHHRDDEGPEPYDNPVWRS